MVKLPFAAPAIEVSIPITDATSAARCMALVVRSSDSACEMPEPWKSDAMTFALDMYSDALVPMFL